MCAKHPSTEGNDLEPASVTADLINDTYYAESGSEVDDIVDNDMSSGDTLVIESDVSPTLPITPPNGVAIVGPAAFAPSGSTSIPKIKGTTADTILSPANRTLVRGLILDGTDTATKGIELTDGQNNFAFHNIAIRDVSGEGIYQDGAYQVSFSGTIRSCTTGWSVRRTGATTPSQTVAQPGTIFEGCGDSIIMKSGTSFAWYPATNGPTTGRGFDIPTSGTVDEKVNNVVYQGGDLEEAGSDGIRLGRVENATVCGVKIRDVSGDGVKITPDVVNAGVMNVLETGASGTGLNIESGTGDIALFNNNWSSRTINDYAGLVDFDMDGVDTFNDDRHVLPGDINHDGSELGLFGTNPVSQQGSYSLSNVTTDRSLDADNDTLAEVADVLGSLISDLQNYGLIS